MAEQALTQLHARIEAIRRQAFDEGYVAAMKAVHELASRSLPQQSDNSVQANGNGRTEEEPSQPDPNQAATLLRTSDPTRRSPAKPGATRSAPTAAHRSRRGRAKRGINARMIQKILKKAAPRAVRQADIRRALQHQGVSVAYPSIGHALGQLKARKAAKQVGKSGTWRYSATA